MVVSSPRPNPSDKPIKQTWATLYQLQQDSEAKAIRRWTHSQVKQHNSLWKVKQKPQISLCTIFDLCFGLLGFKGGKKKSSYSLRKMEEGGGAISKPLAVVACAAMALFYVAILYAPTLVLRLPPPSSYKDFMIRRFICAATSSLVSVFLCSHILHVSFS